MTTITLELPNDLVEQFQRFDPTTLIQILRKTLIQPAREGVTMKLLPPMPLPKPKFKITHEEWKQRLLAVSVWTDDEIQEIEKTRGYVNQWQPQMFF